MIMCEHKEKECVKCHRVLPFAEYFLRNKKERAHAKIERNLYFNECKKCSQKRKNENAKKRRKGDPQYRLWESSRATSSIRGHNHTIRKQDIPLPTHCPLLGIELNYDVSEIGSVASNAATIDRIDSTLGYEAGNIQVLSNLANRMKTNATTDQLVRFARGVLSIYGDVNEKKHYSSLRG